MSEPGTFAPAEGIDSGRAPAPPHGPGQHSHPSSLQVALFLLTVLSTTLLHGYGYAAALVSILLVHEMGHFIASRRHRVAASWPYFIPMPLNPFGTMGAVIAIRSFWKDRRALFDIGVAGPLAGFVLAVPVLAVGFSLSKAHLGPIEAPQLDFGNSLLVSWLQVCFAPPVPEGGFLVFHPLGFAGWVGLFVTWMNLLPIGQLDGGHIAYALLGSRPVLFLMRWQKRLEEWIADRAVARWILRERGLAPEPRRFFDRPPVEAVLALLAGLFGFFGRSRPTFLGGLIFLGLIAGGVHGVAAVGFDGGGASWFFLAGLILLFRFRHPPTLDDEIPLDKGRVFLGIMAAVIFVITFIPIPVRLIE